MVFKELILTDEEFNGGKVPEDFNLEGKYGVWKSGSDQYFTFSAGRYWVAKRQGTLLTDEQLLKRGKEVTGWYGFKGRRNSADGKLANSGRRSFWFTRTGNCYMGQAFHPSGAAIVQVPHDDGCGVVYYTPAED